MELSDVEAVGAGEIGAVVEPVGLVADGRCAGAVVITTLQCGSW
jgi:hypothetical protein